jgi:hypothetical protein
LCQAIDRHTERIGCAHADDLVHQLRHGQAHALVDYGLHQVFGAQHAFRVAIARDVEAMDVLARHALGRFCERGACCDDLDGGCDHLTNRHVGQRQRVPTFAALRRASTADAQQIGAADHADQATISVDHCQCGDAQHGKLLLRCEHRLCLVQRDHR